MRIGWSVRCAHLLQLGASSMLRRSNMLIQLDVATRVHHPEADARWLDLTLPGATREQYLMQLVKVYGFEAPLESTLAYTPRRALRAYVPRAPRARAGLIVQDLLALGLR